MPKLDFTKKLFQDDPAEAMQQDFIPAEIDAKPFIEQFKKHERRIELMAKQVKELKIVDDASHERATAMGSTASKANKELESLRKKIVKPYNDFVSTVNRACKMYTGKIKNLIIEPIKDKDDEYTAKKELEIKRQQEEARKAAEKLDKKLKKEAASIGVDAPDVTMPKVKDSPVGPVKTTPGTGFRQKRWTYDVVDLKKVPREYLVLDKGKVTKAINAGERKIPGLNIYQKSRTAYRTG